MARHRQFAVDRALPKPTILYADPVLHLQFAFQLDLGTRVTALKGAWM